MELEKLAFPLTVCKAAAADDIDLRRPFYFIGRTDEELSLVCPTEDVPPRTLAREDGWRGFRVRGPLDFSLVGILARISSVLAESGISIFAVSTFDTDYILVKEKDFPGAEAALTAAGYTLR
ncbi:MAG: ACT domain-containing protein [Firmicutes bacterium]|nr:ACT domain-containing protein [Bacillota bacterium]